ncbi:MAG TPA: hypothetical protein PKB10_04730, partial [Tepidisphaeraceae bacterium]|nr:hypothetical protein [Tepidisphaeraceae bacterium]
SYDDVTLDSSTFFGQSLLALGLGADRATIRGSVFHGASTLPHPDDWDDDVHREILLGWDFNDGMQGWTTGFANYPKGQVVGTDANGRPVLAEEAYILDAGIKTLPPELGANSRGISFTFRNNSDELQSFATTKLEALAGVAASRKYRLYVEVVLSTNLPSNPGTILHAYVGAAPEAPVVARSPDDQHAPFQHRINNLDLGVYGYFNRPGEDGSFAGFVNNGLPDEQIAWGTTRISHTHSTVQSSEGGKLHPIIMVHSTFETTQHFYIHSTRIRLVPL